MANEDPRPELPASGLYLGAVRSDREDSARDQQARLREALSDPEPGHSHGDVGSRSDRGRQDGLWKDARLPASALPAHPGPAARRGGRRSHRADSSARSRAGGSDLQRGLEVLQGSGDPDHGGVRRHEHDGADQQSQARERNHRVHARPHDRHPVSEPGPPCGAAPRVVRGAGRGGSNAGHGVRAADHDDPAERPAGPAVGDVFCDVPDACREPGEENAEEAGDDRGGRTHGSGGGGVADDRGAHEGAEVPSTAADSGRMVRPGLDPRVRRQTAEGGLCSALERGIDA